MGKKPSPSSLAFHGWSPELACGWAFHYPLCSRRRVHDTDPMGGVDSGVHRLKQQRPVCATLRNVSTVASCHQCARTSLQHKALKTHVKKTVKP